MATHTLRILMNGVTGRMGQNQHLVRSILAIRAQGGVLLANDDRVVPEPVLAGRDPAKLQALARAHGLADWTTDVRGALADPAIAVYFDAQTTALREAAVRAAIDAGKAVYCEKPVAGSLEGALDLARHARRRGVKNGVVQDKLFLPGIRALERLVDTGFFGRILSVHGEFGYWVFEGHDYPPQRPSWNYRKEDGGGIVLDMFPHWRYLLDHLFGRVKAVCCTGAAFIPERLDERGRAYSATADDAAYGWFELEGGVFARIASSWCTRVSRDDLLVLQVDGTEGSAVATLRDCKAQSRANTPRAVWNPDVPSPLDFSRGWEVVPDAGPCANAFKVEWEMFLHHVVAGGPFAHDLLEGARGVQLAELAMTSRRERRWVDVPVLEW
jgi:predicted dehydrogenase